MSQIIIKLHDANEQQYDLRKILANIPLKSFVDLISVTNLEANPRLAKTSRVTQQIEESLNTNGEYFHFMSKGVLVAAREVEALERGRFRLTFEDQELEGILDGGHNTLAIGRFVLKKVLSDEMEESDASEYVDKKLKSWQSFKEVWSKYENKVSGMKNQLPEIYIPIEVIHPSADPEGIQHFEDMLLQINAARNNNAELTQETRANKKGYYEEIRKALDAEIANQVEWKTNDGGRIKVRDIIALSMIPLSKLGSYKSLQKIKNNPTVIFSSKGQCVQFYEDLMAEDGVTQDVKGDIIEIVDPHVLSALQILSDLPALFDLIYEKLPPAYNHAGGKFARIEGVKGGNDHKAKYKTHFYRKPVSYSYGEGYVYPLVVALSALMKVEGDKVVWVTDPYKFVEKNINTVMRSFYSMISGQQYDPAKVGKEKGCYNLAYDLFLSAYKNELLEKHGLG